MITLAHLRELVREHLGPGLGRATPEASRAFVAYVQAAMADRPRDGRYVLDDEPAADYDQILRHFLWRTLEAPTDEAVALLWLLAFEACFLGGEVEMDECAGPPGM